MGLKTSGVGHFQIPAAPAGGTSCTSGTANAFTGTAVVLSASTSAIYITGVHVESAAALAATYICVQLMIGGAGSETAVGQYLVPLSTGSTVALGYRQIYPPIPIANAARLSVKTADSVGSKATLITVECILQSNDKTGYSLTTSDWAKAGDAMALTAAYDAAKTAATASAVTAVKAKTDGLTFTLAGKLDVNLLVVNGVTLGGAGTAVSPWGPA